MARMSVFTVQGLLALSIICRLSSAFSLLSHNNVIFGPRHIEKEQRIFMSSIPVGKALSKKNGLDFSWHHSTIRVRDPAASLPFYQDLFGMRLVGEAHENGDGSTSFFLASPQATAEEHFTGGLWNFPGTCIELRHEKDVPKDPSFRYSNGNVEPFRGFGHLAFFTDDVYEACDLLADKGVQFQKKPNDGRMKGLAFALDPDGYWIEIIKRAEGTSYTGYTLCQTMLRVKDPQKSLEFYRGLLGMDLLLQKDFSDFSLFFLQSGAQPESGSTDNDPDRTAESIGRSPLPILELTHNHGTENNPDFSYHNGNTDPKGFGHLGFTLNSNLDNICQSLEEFGYEYDRRLDHICVKDPDNYPVLIFESSDN